MTPTQAGGSSALGLRVLSVCMGVFFLFMGVDKAAWLGDPGLLTAQLRGWHGKRPRRADVLDMSPSRAPPCLPGSVPVGRAGSRSRAHHRNQGATRRGRRPGHGAELPLRDGGPAALQLPVERVWPARPGQSDGAGDWRRPPAVQHHVSTRTLMPTG